MLRGLCRATERRGERAARGEGAQVSLGCARVCVCVWGGGGGQDGRHGYVCVGGGGGECRATGGGAASAAAAQV